MVVEVAEGGGEGPEGGEGRADGGDEEGRGEAEGGAEEATEEGSEGLGTVDEGAVAGGDAALEVVGGDDLAEAPLVDVGDRHGDAADQFAGGEEGEGDRAATPPGGEGDEEEG